MEYIISIGLPDKLEDNSCYYNYGEIVKGKNIINEKEYLTVDQQKVSYKHLAEFACWWVIDKYNPLNLKDDDIISFISTAKFTNKTDIEVNQIKGISKDVIKENGIMFFQPYYNRPFNIIDTVSFFDVYHFKQPNIQELFRLKNIRNNFKEFPNCWCNYICCTYLEFQKFMNWLKNNLMNIFFDKNLNVINEKLIKYITPDVTIYQPYRIFGMIVEFGYHKYFVFVKIHQREIK